MALLVHVLLKGARLAQGGRPESEAFAVVSAPGFSQRQADRPKLHNRAVIEPNEQDWSAEVMFAARDFPRLNWESCGKCL